MSRLRRPMEPPFAALMGWCYACPMNDTSINATPTVRPAQRDDIDAISRLSRERYAILAQADSRFMVALEAQDTLRADMQARLETGGVLVAMLAGQCAGYIAGKVTCGIGQVDHIALDAHRYYGGVGRALLVALRAWLGEQGGEGMLVKVPRYSPVEQAFWRALGATACDLKTLLRPHCDRETWQIGPEWLWLSL